jgi:formylmethanofuran dehydrogenase subunit E
VTVEREIQKTREPVGRLQMFRLAKVESAQCSECREEKTSKNWAVLDGSWDHRLCNGCYGEICATEGHPYLGENR